MPIHMCCCFSSQIGALPIHIYPQVNRFSLGRLATDINQLPTPLLRHHLQSICQEQFWECFVRQCRSSQRLKGGGWHSLHHPRRSHHAPRCTMMVISTFASNVLDPSHVDQPASARSSCYDCYVPGEPETAESSPRWNVVRMRNGMFFWKLYGEEIRDLGFGQEEAAIE